MKNLIVIAAVLGVFSALVGCSTPSICPIVSDDVRALDPGLVGVWVNEQAEDGDRSLYHVTEEDGRYMLRWEPAEPGKPVRRWAFELARLGEHVVADLTLASDDAERVNEEFGTVAIAGHCFMRVRRDADRLSVWVVNDDWLEEGLRSGALALAHARRVNGDVVLTAPTPDLQAFFRQYAAEPRAWRDEVRLVRVKPSK